MPVKQIATALLFSVLNMLIGCTTIVNRNPDDFRKKPKNPVYGIGLSPKINSVTLTDRSQVDFDDNGGDLNFSSKIVQGKSDKADSVYIDWKDIAAFQFLEMRDGSLTLVSYDLSLFKERIWKFDKVRFNDATFLTNRVSFDRWGHYDDSSGVITGHLKNGIVIEKKLEEVMSVRVMGLSYTRTIILGLLAAGFAGLIIGIGIALKTYEGPFGN